MFQMGPAWDNSISHLEKCRNFGAAQTNGTLIFPLVFGIAISTL
tara:strand:- start:355 stop:486 length:132 start_codon:yes stop_codon:yes gene_type:complete